MTFTIERLVYNIVFFSFQLHFHENTNILYASSHSQQKTFLRAREHSVHVETAVSFFHQIFPKTKMLLELHCLAHSYYGILVKPCSGALTR